MNLKKISQLITLSYCACFMVFTVFAQEQAGVTEKEPELEMRRKMYISDIFQDSKEMLWFGTYGDGLVSFDGTDFNKFEEEQGFNAKHIRSIEEDKNGKIWLATSDGLYNFNGKNFTTFTREHGLPHDDIRSLMIDRKGTIWVGTFNGISRYDGLEFTSFALPEADFDYVKGISKNQIINCMLEDDSGKLWFGTDKGVYVYDGSKFNHITVQDGLSADEVNDIFEDSTGKVWFAMRNGAVCYSEENNFIEVLAGRAIRANATHIYEDDFGDIWLAVEGDCLYRHNKEGELNKFFNRQGCISHTLNYSLKDKNDLYWFGGWSGLFSCRIEQ